MNISNDTLLTGSAQSLDLASAGPHLPFDRIAEVRGADSALVVNSVHEEYSAPDRYHGTTAGICVSPGSPVSSNNLTEIFTREP